MIEKRDQVLLIGVEAENAMEENNIGDIWAKLFQVEAK